MSAADVVVVVATALGLVALGWFFFGPRRAGTAALDGGVQRIEVTVRGGYRPDVIRVRQGVPVELVFDRQESGECTSRVVFPALRASAALPAYQRTTIRLQPTEPGVVTFACGMNMVHGKLLVEPAGSNGSSGSNGSPAAAAHEVDHEVDRKTAPPPPRTAAEEEAADAAERQAEIADLTRRVVVGALLTAPVLLAVMLESLLGEDRVPGLLLEPWFQLALITPVMFYTGWPIHRIGWLSLRNRTAEMNTLITLGTTAAYGFSLLVTVA